MKSQEELAAAIADLETILHSQAYITGGEVGDDVVAQLMFAKWMNGDPHPAVVALREATRNAAAAIRKVEQGQKKHRAN